MLIGDILPKQQAETAPQGEFRQDCEKLPQMSPQKVNLITHMNLLVRTLENPKNGRQTRTSIMRLCIRRPPKSIPRLGILYPRILPPN